MTTTPGNASSSLPGTPPVVDLATWQAAREELLVREKAHTREGDAIAAARRRLPMVELDGALRIRPHCHRGLLQRCAELDIALDFRRGGRRGASADRVGLRARRLRRAEP